MTSNYPAPIFFSIMNGLSDIECVFANATYSK